MINDVTTAFVASGFILFVIMAWITIHFGRKPRNVGSPPRDSSDVNIVYYLVIFILSGMQSGITLHARQNKYN